MQNITQKFTFRINKELKEKLEKLAEEDGRSLNNYLNKTLADFSSKKTTC